VGPRLISGTPEIAQAFVVVGAVILVAATFIDINIGLIAILMSMLLSPELEVGAAADRAITLRADDLILILVSIAWLAKMAIKTTPALQCPSHPGSVHTVNPPHKTQSTECSHRTLCSCHGFCHHERYVGGRHYAGQRYILCS